MRFDYIAEEEKEEGEEDQEDAEEKEKKTAGEEKGNKKIESVPRRSSRAYPPLTRRASPSFLSFSHFPQGYFLVNLSTKSSIRDPIVLDKSTV
ncbi:hypothetical protein HZH68_009491 [Vespula germanica]|uniref:Uncharacterized protein n=1 Tax=Vespula germanica TaxID=30212 RepID=A0A834JXH1_VESGE|nr:hypothetical protein HZH68_009491 [Vespula germanica]